MSERAPIPADELAELLCEHGFAEDKPGYGHATGEDIAAWLTERFVITERYSGNCETRGGGQSPRTERTE